MQQAGALYTRAQLIAVKSSPLIPRPPSDALKVMKSLYLTTWRRTRRGTRAGVDKKRTRPSNALVRFGLVNAHSARNKPELLHNLLLSSDLDILAVTETWLTDDEHGEADLAVACPNGYSASHVPRLGRKGGGVAVIFKDSMSILAHPRVVYSSFEHLDTAITFKAFSLRLVTIYRPPSSRKPTFLAEFSTLIETLSSAGGHLLIVGDFNLDGYPKLNDITAAAGLVQHVRHPTHTAGGILDLVISRATDQLVADTWVGGLLSDHFVVHCELRFFRPPPPIRSITFRPLKLIVPAAFIEDARRLTIVTDPAAECERLIAQYNEGLVSLLDAHAPVRRRTIVVRPISPWYSSEVADARRKRRAAERRWRANQLTVYREMLVAAQREVTKAVRKAKISLLSKKVSECGSDQKALFRLVDGLLGKNSALRLPQHTALRDLLQRF